MEKPVIEIPKKTIPFKCKWCNLMVNILNPTPMTIETDDIIIHTWNYGHLHKKILHVVNQTFQPDEEFTK